MEIQQTFLNHWVALPLLSTTMEEDSQIKANQIQATLTKEGIDNRTRTDDNMTSDYVISWSVQQIK